jgi:hypothetical protein
MYHYDASYALEVYGEHPDRFRLKPVDPANPAVIDAITDWAGTKGMAGIRVFSRNNVSTDPAINRILAAAARHSLPVNLACTGRLTRPASRRRETLVRGW